MYLFQLTFCIKHYTSYSSGLERKIVNNNIYFYNIYIFISITTNLQYLWFLCSLWWCEPPVSVVSCQCWCTRCHCRATRPHQPALVTPNMSPLFVNLATKTASDKQNIFNFNFLCVSCMLCLNWHFAFAQAETTDFQFETYILISAR